MENNRKQLLVRDTSLCKEFNLPEYNFSIESNLPQNKSWKVIGRKRPIGSIDIWYVSENEKSKAIAGRKEFCDGYNSSEYFFETRRIDGHFIEGFLGHDSIEIEYFDKINRQYAYFIKYLKRNKVYFSFDKINLYQLTTIFTDNPVRLLLKQVDNFSDYKANTAFMIMPFGDKQLNHFYEVSVRKFLKDRLDLDVYTAADFTDNDIIIDTIYKSIEQSEFVIAETTKDNKNAFYELGYAFAKEREIITIQNVSQKQFFFDRAHVRTISYSLDDIQQFQENLLKTIQTIRSRR